MPRFIDISGDPPIAAAQDVREAIGAVDTTNIQTAESLGIPCDGVTDAAPYINALPAETGGIYFTGTILCKSKIVIPHHTHFVGSGRMTAIFLFDKTASWGANPILLQLGTDDDIAFDCKLVNCSVDGNDIPGSIGVYSQRINERSGLFGVNVRRCVSKGVYIYGGAGGEIAQNYTLNELEVVMSGDGETGSIGIDIEGGAAAIREICNVTVTVSNRPPIASDWTAIRVNRLYGGSIRNVHMEGANTGVLLGDEYPTQALTLDNIHGWNVDTLVKIVDPSESTSHNCNISILSLKGQNGGTNLLVDEQQSRTYTSANNGTAGTYYLVGKDEVSAASMQIETNMKEASDAVSRVVRGVQYVTNGLTVDAPTSLERLQFQISSQTLSSPGAVTFNAAAGTILSLNLAANCTSSTVANGETTLQGRQFVILQVRQDGTGSRSMSWPSNVEYAGGSAPTTSTGSSRSDIVGIMYVSSASKWYEIFRSLDVPG